MRRIRQFMGGAIVVFLALAVLSGCSDDSNPAQPVDEFAPPSDLVFTNGDGDVLLDWDASTDATLDDFAGYHVYRNTTSMAGATGTQLNAYKLTTQPIMQRSYLDDSATNGTRYFYAVRAVKDNGDLSAASNEVDTAPRPEFGTVTIHEFRSAGNPSGLELSTGQAFAMESSSPDNRLNIDLYLGTTGANDESDQPLAIKSPHLVQSQSAPWSGRVAEFKVLDDWDVSTSSTTGWSNEIPLAGLGAGAVIAVRTPLENGERHYGKIQLGSSKGTAGQRELDITQIAYQPRADYIRFVRKP